MSLSKQGGRHAVLQVEGGIAVRGSRGQIQALDHPDLVAAGSHYEGKLQVVHFAEWLAKVIGYPADAAGTLTSGGSIANLTAFVTAREARDPEGGGAIYCSFDFACAWAGGHQDAALQRAAIRDAMEFGVNAAFYANARHRAAALKHPSL